MEQKQDFLKAISKINPNYDLELIGKAFDKAKELHEGQFRKSGEPYFIHPIAVTKILAELGMDEITLIGGLMHDVVEDTEYTREDLAKDFGDEAALLVDGVTKLGAIKSATKEAAQAENLRKMFLAMSKDIRVLIIKLADRLHNMRTMEFMKPKKQLEKSKETIEIYAPLASRLGIYSVKFELENLALKYLDPEAYDKLEKEIATKKNQREAHIEKVISDIEEAAVDMDIEAHIYGRSKHIYSVYKKMKYQHKQLDEIFDLMAIRIIVDSIKDCYSLLGMVHTMWKPLPGRFKDYIAMPKANMYQSLHTTVIGDRGEPFEIQIRTFEMHQIAEYGIAAHWKYKEGKTGATTNQDEMKLAWLRQTLEWQKDLDDPTEFMEALKMDLFSSQVFVFTPQGEVIDLPKGSVPIDFAFKIHTDVGCRCVGAKVNGKMVTIDHVLNNGDIVEIITSPNSSGPSIDWLKIVKSSSARNKIRQWLKKENKEEDLIKGRESLERYLKERKLEPSKLLKPKYINKAVKELNIGSFEEILIQISTNSSMINKVATTLLKHFDEGAVLQPAGEKPSDQEMINSVNKAAANTQRRRKSDEPAIIVKGMDNLMIRVAQCCNPVPGDDIVGFITKGRGISVHRRDCSNVKNLLENDNHRFIPVEWESVKEGKFYNANICIISLDRKHMFSDISRACEDMDIHISGVNGRVEKDGDLRLIITLAIDSTHQMERILRVLRNIEDVKQVYRVNN